MHLLLSVTKKRSSSTMLCKHIPVLMTAGGDQIVQTARSQDEGFAFVPDIYLIIREGQSMVRDIMDLASIRETFVVLINS